MISVKDQNGDGKITGGKSVKNADVIQKDSPEGSFIRRPYTEDRMKTETITENIIFSMHQGGKGDGLFYNR